MFDLISTIKGDPGYVEDVGCYEVYLDGSRLEHCVSADVIQGEAICYILNNDGDCIIENNNLVSETLYGDIKILRIKGCKELVQIKRKGFVDGR